MQFVSAFALPKPAFAAWLAECDKELLKGATFPKISRSNAQKIAPFEGLGRGSFRSPSGGGSIHWLPSLSMETIGGFWANRF
jgi:hypothetical protein